MKSLYLDITSGISGDIFLAVLLSFYQDENDLSLKVSKMLNKDIHISLEQVRRNSIMCNKLSITCDINNEPFRSFTTIKDIILNSNFSDFVKNKSIEAFYLLAETESQIHGIDIEKVHFHEIGAVDTIIDIVCSAYLIEKLDISHIEASIIPLGHGNINTEHGIIMLPAPATLRLLKNIPVKRIDINGELVTPTGALLLKTFVSNFSNNFQGIVEKDSFITGSLSFENLPNICRALMLNHIETDKILEIETNIDDMTGELLAYLHEKLMANNALDVIFIPAFSKKNRPIYILKVLILFQDKEKITDIIFKYSSTSGFRISEVNRIKADRDFIEKTVMGYTVKVKRIVYKDNIKYAPEWEDCKKIAEIKNVSPLDIMNMALK